MNLAKLRRICIEYVQKWDDVVLAKKFNVKCNLRNRIYGIQKKGGNNLGIYE